MLEGGKKIEKKKYSDFYEFNVTLGPIDNYHTSFFELRFGL